MSQGDKTETDQRNAFRRGLVFMGPFIISKGGGDNEFVKKRVSTDSKAIVQLAEASAAHKIHVKAQKVIYVTIPRLITFRLCFSSCESPAGMEELRQQSGVLFNPQPFPFPVMVFSGIELLQSESGSLEAAMKQAWEGVDPTTVVKNGTLECDIKMYNQRNQTIKSLWLLAAALRCLEANVEVRAISCPESCPLSSLDSFMTIKQMFPELTRIECSGSLRGRRAETIMRHLASAGVSVENRDEKKKILPFSARKGPIDLFGAESTFVEPGSVSQFQDVSMDGKEFEFLREFLRVCAEGTLEEIGQCYAPMSVMSLTVQMVSHDAPLAFYEQFDHNLLKNTDDTLIEGRNAIVEAYEVIFGEHFISVVTSMDTTRISPELQFVTLHGVFEPAEQQLFGFDRTLVIGVEGEKCMILNDQLYLRTY